MKYILLFLTVIACGNHHSKKLPQHFVLPEKPEAVVPTLEAENNFKSIIKAQEKALNDMTDAPGPFRMQEMITDIAVAKTGLLGLSALKSNNGVEIKWGRASLTETSPQEKADFVIEENMDVEEASGAIAELAEKSGKIRVTANLRSRISQSLNQVETLMEEAGTSVVGNWEFKGVRFDLNFSANGEIFFFTKAGPNLRLRMEWNHKRSNAKMTPASQLVMKTMAVLNQVNTEMSLPGFSVKQLSIGVGTTYKGHWGIWKYSTGFLGFLLFIPSSTKNFSQAIVADKFNLGESVLTGEQFVTGLRKSLQTAAFFADAANSRRSEWFVKEIKTVNDISYTGLFGLADYTTKGTLEIDFKRNN